MKKKDLTRILIGDSACLAHLAQQVEAGYSVQIARAAECSLVMLKTLDPVAGQPFYLGEVMVTECTVEIEGSRGLGVIMGDEPERAYQLAVVDAAMNARVPEVESWWPLVAAAAENLARKQKEEFTRNQRSQVNFETMEEHYAKR